MTMTAQSLFYMNPFKLTLTPFKGALAWALSPYVTGYIRIAANEYTLDDFGDRWKLSLGITSTDSEVTQGLLNRLGC